jgi:diacylglycerol kinase (CTP)
MEKVELKKRSDLHLARKAWHITGVLIMALIHSATSTSTAIFIAFVGCLFILPIDILRQRSSKLNDLVIHLFKPFMRQSELNQISGNTYLILGVLSILLIFPREIVALTILFLAFADPIASFFGVKFGKDKIWGDKSLQGFLAAFITCSLVAFGFLYYNNIMSDRLLLVSLIAGIIGAISELIQIGKLDDNFSLPVLSATGLFVLFHLFGGFA